MEKEHKITFITKAVFSQIREKKITKKYDLCFNEQMNIKKIESEIKKATSLVIYDITHAEQEKEGKTIHINDHINKTGKNLLIKKNKVPVFIDISRLYTYSRKGVVTTGLGNYYTKYYKETEYPSSDLCLISVWCKSVNANLNIKGKLVNTFL